MSFLGELRRRSVFKVGAAYLMIAWLIVQVVGNLNDPLNLPEGFDTVVVVLLAIGLPVALILAWAYEVTPEGAQPTSPRERSSIGTQTTAKRLNLALASLLALVLVFVLADTFWLDSAKSSVLPNSVAVIPFENIDTDEETDRFTRAVWDEFMDQLLALESLTPIAKATMRVYAGTTKSAREIAQELNTEWVIYGSVQRSSDGSLVKVTLELIDPETNLQSWSQPYESETSELFALRADMARHLASSLRIELSGEEQERLAAVTTTRSQEALEYYLASLSEPAVFDSEANARALDWLDRALAIDEDFAESLSYKSLVLGLSLSLTSEGHAETKRAVIEAARAAARLKPNDGLIRFRLAFAYAYEGDWENAELEVQRGIRRGMTLAQSHEYALAQISVGDFEAAQATLEEFRKIDPLNEVAAAWLLYVYEMTGNRQARRELLERGDELHQVQWFGQQYELFLRLGEGDSEALQALLARLRGTEFVTLGEPYLDDAVRGRQAIRTFYSDQNALTPPSLIWIAAWSAYFDDTEFALELLRDAMQMSALNAHFLWMPVFEDVRARPEFEALLEESGLIDYWSEKGRPSFVR